MTWIIIKLGLGASVAVGVLQLEVGVALLVFWFQTKFSGHLLFASQLPPLATLPDYKADEREDEDKAPEEDVGPPAQDLGLELFLLLALRNGGFLALIGRKQSMRSISRDISAIHPRVNEVGMRRGRVGDWHQVSEGVIVESPTLDAIRGHQFGWRKERQSSLQVPKVNVCIHIAH